MSCNPLITDDFLFPRPVHNRPGLPRVGYRIGFYADCVEAMLRRIDAAPELAAWTHRGSDDPGIALLEGAALVAEVLGFYQEHYANEAFLRTAAWRESVADLVRLTGYRLAPGLGGRATFAFELRPNAPRPLTIRAGFPVKAELQDASGAAEFQTVAELAAWPALGRFHLWRGRTPRPTLAAGSTVVELASVGGAGDVGALAAFDLQPGDRLMLLPGEAMFSTPGTAYAAQPAAQVVTVAKVRPLLDRVLVELEAGPVQDWAAPVRALRLGRAFRHFGHNAPPQVVTPITDGSSGQVTGSRSTPTVFERHIGHDTPVFTANVTASAAMSAVAATTAVAAATARALPAAAGTGARSVSGARASAGAGPGAGASAIAASASPGLAASVSTGLLDNLELVLAGADISGLYTALQRSEMALDVEAPEMTAGRLLVAQGTATFRGQSVPVPFTVTRRIAQARGRTVSWGNLGGASTVLALDARLFANSTLRDAVADIRELRFHEITSPELVLRPLAAPASGAFASGTAGALFFFGTAADAAPLAGRRLFLRHADGRTAELTCTSAPADFIPPEPALAAVPRRWALSFDRVPAPFAHDDFDEEAPTVEVFGNLADATQGKAEREAVLGHGDAGLAFQTFTLPKSPLTYLLAGDATPPHRPELEVRVNGRAWTRVDVLYGRGPQEQVFIVREDAEGRSHVQFGDGETGARLPSGLNNVVAVFRTGVGARGPVKPGAAPTAPERPPGFDKVTLAGVVSGGADPEDADKAREAAPGRVQSLGRLVSLRDHETETLALPGVVAAAAAWALHAGVPAVLLRVLLESGREAEFEAVRAAVAHAQRCRGPDRHPVVVQQALPRFVFCDVAYARDPSWPAADVAAALRAALGLAGDEANARDGLFGLHARRLGGREHATRIEGRLQNVAGVLWCRVTALGLFPSGATDPAALAPPAAPRPRRAVLAPAPHELLQLDARHLALTETAEPAAGECA